MEICDTQGTWESVAVVETWQQGVEWGAGQCIWCHKHADFPQSMPYYFILILFVFFPSSMANSLCSSFSSSQFSQSCAS